MKKGVSPEKKLRRNRLDCTLISPVSTRKLANSRTDNPSSQHREMVIEVRIRWRTEALTDVTVPRPKVVADARRTDAQVVARVRELAPTQTATQIALLLNEEGLHPGLGGSFTASKVDWIRAAYDIPLDCPRSAWILSQRATRRWTLLSPGGGGTAECECLDHCGLVQREARLESVRAGTHGPRWITLTPEIIAELRKPVQRNWKRRGDRQRT